MNPAFPVYNIIAPEKGSSDQKHDLYLLAIEKCAQVKT